MRDRQGACLQVWQGTEWTPKNPHLPRKLPSPGAPWWPLLWGRCRGRALRPGGLLHPFFFTLVEAELRAGCGKWGRHWGTGWGSTGDPPPRFLPTTPSTPREGMRAGRCSARHRGRTEHTSRPGHTPRTSTIPAAHSDQAPARVPQRHPRIRIRNVPDRGTGLGLPKPYTEGCVGLPPPAEGILTKTAHHTHTQPKRPCTPHTPHHPQH